MRKKRAAKVASKAKVRAFLRRMPSAASHKKAHAKLVKQLRADLMATLPRYISTYYGDPVTSRPGVIMDGPVTARLAAASSLLALLKTEQAP